MNRCFNNGLNGICDQKHRSVCPSVPVPVPVPMPIQRPPGGLTAYGSVYQNGEKQFNIAFPGETASITFSDNAVLSSDVSHTPETAEIGVASAGDYETLFVLYVNAAVSAPVTFALQANGVNLPGGVFSRMLVSGDQMVIGNVMATLEQKDIVRLVFTASSALSFTLSGANVTGTMSIKKLN